MTERQWNLMSKLGRKKKNDVMKTNEAIVTVTRREMAGGCYSEAYGMSLEKLKWAMELGRTHRNLEPVLKKGRKRLYLTVRTEEEE